MQVDHATLHQAASDVRHVEEEVSGDLTRLRGIVQGLAGAWQGTAGTAYQNLMLKWDGDVNKLLKALSDIADLLDKSGTQHQVNDEQQQQNLNRFHSLLNP